MEDINEIFTQHKEDSNQLLTEIQEQRNMP